MKTRHWLFISILFVLGGIFGCTPTEPTEKGGANIAVSTSALSRADITSVRITVSGEYISPDLIANLDKDPVSGLWSGTIDNIPAGSGRTILAEALNGSTVIYSGSVSNQTIIPNQTLEIYLYMNQVTPPDPLLNSVPKITSLVISDATVDPEDTVSLTVTATDADPGDTLTYAWIADGGTFGNPTTANTTWTAPNQGGNYQLTVSVTDPHNVSATITLSIDVHVYYDNSENGLKGSAAISVHIDTSPEIQGLVPTPTRISAGESTTLDLTASDADGDTLAFLWSAVGCTGNFSSTTVEDPVFTLVSDDDTDCILQVVVNDFFAGNNQASIVISTAQAVTPEVIPPVVQGPLSWNLGADLYADVSLVTPTNPFEDSYGNPSTWRMMYTTSLSYDPSAFLDVPSNLFIRNDLGTGNDPMVGYSHWFISDLGVKVGMNTNNSYLHYLQPWEAGIPARTAFLRPGANNLVMFAWQSPISGNVQMNGEFRHADAECGDGISWTISRVSSSLDPFEMNAPMSNASGLAGFSEISVAVTTGDVIYLIIDPRGSASGNDCDTTSLAVTITEVL